MFKLLVEAGADLNYQTPSGRTPVEDAADSSWFEAVYYLLEAGADFRLGTGPTDFAFWVIVDRSVERTSDQWPWREKVIDFLEAKGFDFTPAYKEVDKRHPRAAALWDVDMDAAAEKQRRMRSRDS